MADRLDIYRHTTAVINLEHLESNYRLLKEIVGEQVFFCPMVKANAYGHGDVEIALKLQDLGVRSLGVGLVEEGLLLRQMGIKCELLVFGIFDLSAAQQVLKWKMTPVISLWQQFEALETAARQQEVTTISIHLKFDTGMHRLGFDLSDARKLYDKILESSIFELQGVCTHLFRGDDAADLAGDSMKQLERFQEVEKIFSPLSPVSHTLNSAGTLHFHTLRQRAQPLPAKIALDQGVRPGLLLYGVSPFPADQNLQGLLSRLKPVMSLRSHIVRYHRVKAGETVSYGATWKAHQDSVVGVIPIGYADGYHRLLSNRAEVLVNGRRAPQIGNVCMDYIMADVTGLVTELEIEKNLEIEVTLFGFDSGGSYISPTELATKAQTIPWEILTSVGERVPRVVENLRNEANFD